MIKANEKLYVYNGNNNSKSLYNSYSILFCNGHYCIGVNLMLFFYWNEKDNKKIAGVRKYDFYENMIPSPNNPIPSFKKNL